MLLKPVWKLVNLMFNRLFKKWSTGDFIIENSIKEEGIDISEIFSFGASSKGEERGVGLYTVMKIVEGHPNTSLIPPVKIKSFVRF